MEEKKAAPYFPLFVNLQDKKIAVIGGGKVALRKTKTLAKFCREILVVAPDILPGFDELGTADSADVRITMIRRRFVPADLEGIDLAVIATNDAQINTEIANLCEMRGILKNVASDRRRCDFYFPAVLEEDGVVIGIGSGGDPAKTRAVRERLEELLQPDQSSDYSKTIVSENKTEVKK